jgi:hypothetical protein
MGLAVGRLANGTRWAEHENDKVPQRLGLGRY